jgi:hypothetical protein
VEVGAGEPCWAQGGGGGRRAAPGSGGNGYGTSVVERMGTATRRQATVVDSSGKEKARGGKKGRQAAGDEADFMCGAHVRNGAFYGSGRGSLRDSLKVN